MKNLLARLLALALLAFVPASAPAEGIGNNGFAGEQFGTVGLTGSGTNNPGGIPFAENLTPATTTKVLAAYQAMQAGTRDMNITAMGNSTDRGVDESAVPYGSQYPLSVAEQIAIVFNSQNIPSGANNWYGISGSSLADYVSRDNRLTTGGTAAMGSNVIQGGASISMSSATATMSFAPQHAVNSCEVFTLQYAGFNGATLGVSVDGGAATNIVQNATTTIRKTTISAGAVASHTVAVNWVSGSNALYGIDCKDATRKEVTIRQWATSGGTASGMIDNTGTPQAGRLNQNSLYPADLVFGDFGLVNSWRGSVPVATVKAQVEALIDAVKASGSDILFTEPPFDSGSAGNTANQQQYVDVVNASCRAKGCAIFHTRQALVSKANSDALGYTSASDPVHYTIAGQAWRAQNLVPFFRYGMGLSPN